MCRHRLIVVLVAVLGLVFASAPARADVWLDTLNGKSKPAVKWRNADGSAKRVLKVFIQGNGPFAKDVRAAMKNWNDAGAGWTFEEVKPKKKGKKTETKKSQARRADVVVGEANLTGKLGDCTETEGRGKDGSKGGQKVTTRMTVRIDKDGGQKGWEVPGGGPKQEEANRGRWNRERTIKHELGHALGLAHTADLGQFASDVMAEGTEQDPANDEPTLTGHDKKEARTSGAGDVPAPTEPLPGYGRGGRRGSSRSVPGAGSSLRTSSASHVTASPSDATELEVVVTGWDAGGVDLELLAEVGAASQQLYYLDVEHGDETERFAGLFLTADADDPGIGPVAQYSGAAVESLNLEDEPLLDGRDSYHPIPGERALAQWTVDGVWSTAKDIFQLIDVGPGVHLARLSVRDRFGHVDFAEKTVVIGTPTLLGWSQAGGGVSPSMLSTEDAEEGAPKFAVAHVDPVSGQVLYTVDDHDLLVTEFVAPVAPGSRFVSLARDPTTGESLVAFADDGDGALSLARRAEPGGWTVEQVPDPAPAPLGQYCRLGVDWDGRPHVVYVAGGTSEIRHAWLDEGVWEFETVAATLSPSPWIAMALNGDGEPRVAWTDQASVHYAERSVDGWRTEPAAFGATPDLLSRVALGMDGADDPVIVFVDAGFVPTVARHDGVEWQLEPTLPFPPGPILLELDVDEGSDVHLAVQALADPLLGVSYLTRIGDAWSIETVGLEPALLESGGVGIALRPGLHVPCIAVLGSDDDGPGLHVSCQGIAEVDEEP